METKTTGFIAAYNAFFGKKPGQSILGFRNEIAELTEKDKAELTEGLRAAGYNIA